MKVNKSSRARLASGTPRSLILRDLCHVGSVHSRLLASALLLVAACARTGLDPGELDPSFEVPSAPTPTATGEPSPLPTGSAGAPTVTPMPTTTATTPPDSTEPSPPAKEPPHCVPSPETCNGADDDCNGQVDDLPALPCAGGGFQYCVAGKLSSCPRSCEVCVPGSVRVCQNSYCTFWGEQECTADGQGFGPCRESTPPPACAPIAAKQKDSKELEQCCIDDGYCCVDSHDLDGDGDRREMVGACEGVRCP
jgi:hypothetical protein